MSMKSTCLISFVLVLALVNSASALVVSGFQEWNQRTQLEDIGGLEITSTGHARFTARVDHDATDVIIHPGGILETLDTYKLPDGRPQPELSNAYVYGTWNANEIQSFGVERAAYIYVGADGEINLERGYDDSSTSYNVLAWLDEAQLGGRSLFVAPELDPEVWSIQIEDLGGGACRITAYGPPPAAAGTPNPEDGATDVPRDVVLSWTPGEFAPAINGHQVYLSKNFNDVNDGVGGITVSDNSYSPEQRLDFNTMYYWRVDEVNAPPDNTVFEGNIWSFTTEPFAYPIASENITATASSASQEDMGPENTINGSGLDANDLHSTETTDMWLSGDEPNGAWIEYELDKVYKLHEMWVWNSNQALESMFGLGCKDVSIEYSVNGTDYTALTGVPEFAQASGASDYAHNTTVDFGGAAAKYIKLTANSNWGDIFKQYGLSEVQFFSIPVFAREPIPASGATDVALDVVLAWRAGREAAKHDVYFSDDQQAVVDGTASVTTVTETSLGPLALDLGKTYYWRVDEVNDAETPTMWQGDVWNFRTHEYFVVDDMESYNDIDEGQPGSNRIYLAWVDGYDNPAINGSVVGNENAPFAEQTIVHGGLQSMPMSYNNAVGKSEATLTLTSNRDWTVKGINRLTIWFRGEASNAAEQMYVTLNGNARIDHDNPDAAQVDDWTEWNIDLQAFGVNLANVNSITLCLGNRNNPVAGGSGMMYFDDIRLYPPAP